MATTVLLQSLFSTGNTSPYTTASFTPQSGDVIVVAAHASGYAPGTIAISDSQSGSYDQIGVTMTRSGSATTGGVFVRTASPSASGMTVTATFGANPTGCIIFVYALRSMPANTFGASAVRQYKQVNNQALGGTASVTLDTAALTGNNTVFFIFNASNPAAQNPPTDWTEPTSPTGDSGVGSPTQGGETNYRDSGWTGTTYTMGNTSTACTYMLLEFAASNPVAEAYTQTNFRVRSDDSQTLNADAGWAGALNANATIDAETVFRIRFEVAADATGAAATFRLMYRKNGTGNWTEVPTRPSEPATAIHPVDVVLSSQYANNDATTNILSGSGATFEAGNGIEGTNATPSHTLISEHTEFEWALKIPVSYGETTVQHGRNADGDTFEFRVERSDLPFATYTNTPTITLNFPVGILGGTTPESPSRFGPWKDGNGNLYIFQEYADTSAWAIMLKSTDGGDSWVHQTAGGEPTTRDLESVDGQLVGNILHLVSTKGNDNVYHQYAVSTHGTTPDQWIVKDQVIETPASSPTDQKISMVVRSDGTVVAAYRALTSDDIYYRIRSSGGTWGSATELDTENIDWTDVWMQLGESDVTYIFYFSAQDGNLYYKTLSAADSLSARTSVATGLDTGSNFEKPLFGTAYYDDGGVEVITVGYKAADDTLYTRQLRDGTLQTAQQVSTTAVTNHPAGQSSQQPVADLANDGTTLWCLYSDASTRDLWKTSNADGAGWGSATEVHDNVTVDVVRGFIFTHSAGNGGAKVYGYVLDEAAGHTGPIFYHETAISSVTTDTKTHTSDVLVLKTDSKTHTSDTLVYVQGTKTHTSDVLVAVPGTKTHTTDVLVSVQGTKTHTTDVLVYRTETKTHTTDVLVYVTGSLSHTTDVNVSSGVTTDTKTHTTDALVFKTGEQTHTSDVVVLKTSSQTHTSDVYVSARLSLAHTTDVLVLKSDTKTHTSDVVVFVTGSQAHTTDLLVAVAGTKTHTTDLLVLKADTKAHTTDVYAAEVTAWSGTVQGTTDGGTATYTRTHTTDVLVYAQGTKTHTTDVVVLRTETQTHTSDVYVSARLTLSHTTDVLVQRTESLTHTTDLYVSARLTTAHTTDTVILRAESLAHTTDVYVLSAGAVSHTSDVLVLKTDTKTHTTDVLVYTTGTLAHSSDVYVASRLTSTHTTDTLVMRAGTQTHTTDLYVAGTGQQVHTTDVLVLKSDTKAHTTDVLVAVRGTKTHTTDVLVLKTSTREHTTDVLVAVPGTKTHTTDVYVAAVLAATHTTDVLVSVAGTKAHTTDLFVLSAGTSVHTSDVLVRKTETRTHTTDVLVLRAGTRAHTTDVLVAVPGTKSHSTDLLVRATSTREHTTDVLVSRTLTATHSSDVYIAARLTSAHTTDLFVASRLTATHTTDVVVLVTAALAHTTDVLVVHSGLSLSHTTDLEVGLPYKTRDHTTDVYVYDPDPNWPQTRGFDTWPQTDGTGWPQTHHSEEW